MVTKIRPGIFMLEIPIPNNPLENTNVYLLQGKDGCILIDSGWNSDEALRSLGNQMREIDAMMKDIRYIVVTHAHYDHYGLAGKLKELSRGQIALHRREEEVFRSRYTVTEEFLRQSEDWFRSNGVPAQELPITRLAFGGFRANLGPAQPDIHLNGGESIRNGTFELQVIWTPGHSPGHICLYEPSQKILFSGDHVLPVITPNISLAPQSTNNPLGEFLKSLDQVKRLDVKLVLPAHEDIFSDLPARVDEILRHHEIRNTEILNAIGTGALTAYQISQHITWMPELGGVKFEDLMPGDKRAAVSETLAHLRAMTVTGRLTAASRGDITFYQRAPV